MKVLMIKSKNYKFITIFLLSIFYINLHASIAGLHVEIVEAERYGKVHIPLVDKRLHVSNDIFHIGYMQAGKSTQKLIDKNKFYVITLQDNTSKGKLHAIVKGDYMKRRPYHVSALTEVIFLLSQDLLGEHYDSAALETKLNTLSKKIIKRKGFVLDNKFEIDYTDILLYTLEARVLYKPYDKYVTPLESKIKENHLTYEDAYHFVYDAPIREAATPPEKNHKHKKVKPLYPLVRFIHIPKNIIIGTKIETLKQLRAGSAQVDGFEILASSIPFRLDRRGTLTLASALTKDHYSFEAVAHTKDGDSNKISFTIIVDGLKDTKFYKVGK